MRRGHDFMTDLADHSWETGDHMPTKYGVTECVLLTSANKVWENHILIALEGINPGKKIAFEGINQWEKVMTASSE